MDTHTYTESTTHDVMSDTLLPGVSIEFLNVSFMSHEFKTLTGIMYDRDESMSVSPVCVTADLPPPCSGPSLRSLPAAPASHIPSHKVCGGERRDTGPSIPPRSAR